MYYIKDSSGPTSHGGIVIRIYKSFFAKKLNRVFIIGCRLQLVKRAFKKVQGCQKEVLEMALANACFLSFRSIKLSCHLKKMLCLSHTIRKQRKLRRVHRFELHVISFCFINYFHFLDQIVSENLTLQYPYFVLEGSQNDL